jgi:AraC-like DNA-binding protein
MASDSALYVKNDMAPYIDYPLHLHPEYELVYIEKGFGKRIIGDHIDDFTDGDLVFLSPNLPHIWQCDPVFYHEPQPGATSCYVLHFGHDCLGSNFFELPDLLPLQALFTKGENGILLKGNLKKEVTSDLLTLYQLNGPKRIALFIEILLKIAVSDETELLSSVFYKNPYEVKNKERFALLYGYILQNFKTPLKIADIASRLNMTETSLCRYYKKQTDKTLVVFINEIRIKYACRLLCKTNKNITEISFDAGFNNVSYFNRQFKSITNLTPNEYKNLHRFV